MEVILIFSYTRYHKIDKNTTTTVRRFMNELFSPRTMGHLIKKKYQVTGLYLWTKYILGCPELHFWVVVQWLNKKLRPVIERHLDSSAIMLFRGMGSLFLQ